MNNENIIVDSEGNVVNNEINNGFNNDSLFTNSNVALNNNVANNTLEEVEKLDETPLVYDPLNNANNPLPVNPVAPKEEEIFENVSMSFKDIGSMLIGLFLRPASNIKDNAKKFSELYNCLRFTLVITLISVVFSLIGGVIAGGYTINIDPLTGAYTEGFSFDNILQVNFLNYIIKGLVISCVAIFVVSLVYYGASFMNNKGVKLGTYIMISNLSFLPFIIGGSLVLPIVSLFSVYLAICIMIICILYTMVVYIIGVNELLNFSTIDRKVFYNLFNFTLIFVVIMIILYVLIENGYIYLPFNVVL